MTLPSRIFGKACLLVLGILGCSRISSDHCERETKVDAGGHRLHLLIAGKTGPTVVLESGLGGGVGWEQVRTETGRFAQVVTYDRAGIGQSESGPQPRTARQIAAELRAALRSAGLPPPFVLVGHSMGGPYIRVFAAMYPQEVAGLILVDPTQVNAYESMEAIESWFAQNHPQDWHAVKKYCEHASDTVRGLSWMRGLEAKRMEEYLATVPVPQQDAERREWLAQWSRSPAPPFAFNPIPAVRDEFDAATESFRQALAAAPLPKVPIILFAAPGRTSPINMIGALKPELRAIQQQAEHWHLEDYRQWVNATPGAKLMVAHHCGHNIHLDNPQLVVTAIRDVVISMDR